MLAKLRPRQDILKGRCHIRRNSAVEIRGLKSILCCCRLNLTVCYLRHRCPPEQKHSRLPKSLVHRLHRPVEIDLQMNKLTNISAQRKSPSNQVKSEGITPAQGWCNWHAGSAGLLLSNYAAARARTRSSKRFPRSWLRQTWRYLANPGRCIPSTITATLILSVVWLQKKHSTFRVLQTTRTRSRLVIRL